MTPAKPQQLSRQLLLSARNRINTPAEHKTPADLRRAVSDMYYAMFHRVCEAVVLPLGTDTSGIGFADAFSTLYRLPDHASVENRCKPVGSSTFSSAIKDFAAQLVVMKNKRQAADYDPWAKFDISAVQNDLTIVEKVMSGFDATAPDDQTRFAFLIVRRGRPEQKG